MGKMSSKIYHLMLLTVYILRTYSEREQGALCCPGCKVSLGKEKVQIHSLVASRIYVILRFVANENHLVSAFKQISHWSEWPASYSGEFATF